MYAFRNSSCAIFFLWLSAASGSRGALNVTLSNAASTGGSFVARVWTPTASPSRINVSDLLVQLNGGNVVINTNAAGAEAGTITITDAIPLDDLTTTSQRTLSLNAQDDVLVNAAVFQSGAGGNNVPNFVNLVLNANLGSGNGDVALTAEVSSGGGTLTLSGRNLAIAAAVNVNTAGGGVGGTFTGTTALGGNFISTSGGDCTITTAGNCSVSSSIVSSGGNIALRNTAAAAVMTLTGLLDARLAAGAGSVDLRSDAGTLNVTLGEVRSGPAGGIILRSLNAMSVAGIVVGGSLDLNAQGGASDLTIQAGSVITATGAGRFQAGNHLNVNAPLSANGGLTLAADTNAGGVGNVTVPVALTTQNNPIQISGVNFSKTNDAIATNGGDLSLNLTGSADFSGTTMATGGGSCSLNCGTFSILSPITTSGSTFTITAVGPGTIGNDLTTDGGDVSITLSGAGAVLTQSTGSDVNAGGGAGGSSIKLFAVNGVVNTNAGVSSGIGGLEIVAAASSTLKGALSSFFGPVTARLTGTGALLSIEGSVAAGGTNLVSLRSLSGGVTVKAGATVSTGSGGSVLVEALGSTHDVTYAGTLSGGSGGVTLRSNDSVFVQSLLNLTGPLTIAADADLGGLGDAVISAALTAQNSAVAVSGANISITSPLNTNGGTLNLNASGAVTTDATGLSTGGGNLTLAAGSFSLGVVTTSGGSINATALNAGTLANDLTSSGGNISVTSGGTLTLPAGSDVNAGGGAGTGVVSLRSTNGILDLSGSVSSGSTTTVLAGRTGVNFNASAGVTAFNLDVDATGAGNIDFKNGCTVAVTGNAAFDTANGDVVLNAAANFTTSVSSGLSLTARGLGGDLTINRPILIDDANAGLTLRADGDLLLFAAVTTTGGDLTLQADGDGDQLGSVSLTSDISTQGGDVTITGAAAALTSPQILTGGGTFSLTSLGSSSISSGILTSGGNISATLTAAGSLLTLTGNLDGSGGAGTSNVNLRSNAGPVNFAAAGRVRAGPGGTATIFGSTGAVLNGDILAAGSVDVDCVTGNIALGATASVVNSGASMAFDAGNSIITMAAGAILTPGTKSLLHLGVAAGNNNLTIPLALASGAGGIELFSDNDVIISAAVSATGPITIRSDRNASGTGAVNATAAIQSTGGGNVLIRGRGLTLGPVNTTGGDVTLDNDGSALALNGTVSTGGGSLLIETSSAITHAAGGLNLNSGVTGSITISSVAASLVIPATVNFINARGIALTASGAASDITLERALTAGVEGFTFNAPDQLILSATLGTGGPIALRADSDASGSGDLVINAAITGAAESVNLRGSGIAVNAVVDSTTGEISLQPNAGTIATVAANLTGPTRVLSGTARFTTGAVSANALAVNPGAILDFDSPARSLNPASFVSTGETRLRLGGAGSGQFNRIIATGTFTAGGVLTITLAAGFTPSAGQSFDLFDFAGFAGTFTGFNLPAPGANLVWDTSQISVNGSIRLLTPIELWRQLNLGTTANAGPAADTFDKEGDGTVNLMEYALGMNPNVPSVTGLPVHGKVNLAGLNYLTLAFTRPLTATDISYRVQAGNAPTGFSDGSFYSAGGNVPTNAITTEVSHVSVSGFETIVIRDNTPMTAPGSRFLRLKVTRP